MTPMPADPSTELLTAKDAAAYVGVYPDTLRRWVDSGLLPDRRTPGGHRRYRRADLDALIARPERNAS